MTKRAVMETADDDLLEAAGIVVSAEAWHRKGIRINTKVRFALPLAMHVHGRRNKHGPDDARRLELGAAPDALACTSDTTARC